MSLLARDANGNTIQAIKQGRVQNLDYTGTPAVSAAFGSETTIIQATAKTDSYYLVGVNPVVTTDNGTFHPGKVTYFIPVSPGQQIAYIQDTTGGRANITEGKV